MDCLYSSANFYYYYYYYYLDTWEFFRRKLVVFLWSLSDRKSPQVSRTFFCCLADLINVAVWMVSTSLLISTSSSPFNNPFVTTQSTNYIWKKRHFHVTQFFQFLARSRYLFVFSLSFNFTLWSGEIAKSTILQDLFFFVDCYKILLSGLV